MAEQRSIKPTDLLLDTENPRLGRPNEGQRETLRTLSHSQGRKLLALAKDIVESGGLNPSELLIVMPVEGDDYRHIVLEGNRRIVAVKCLENPEAVNGAVETGVLSELRKLSKRYLENPIDGVECYVVKSKEDARHWIELRHTGENEGAGVVRWGADEVGRYRARGDHQLEPHFQALNWLEERGDLSPELRKRVKPASYKRIIDDADLREKLGVEVVSGKLQLLADDKSVAKVLLHIAKDLANKKIKTSDIYKKADRQRYFDSLPKSVHVTPTREAGDGIPLGSAESSKKPKSPKKPSPKPQKPRDRLIPKNCTLSVTDQRCRYIEQELRALSLDGFPNGVAVLFRVFLELSLDDYITSRKLPESTESPLHKKMTATVEDLIARQKMTKNQAVPVRKACVKDSFLQPSITLLHKYVHRQEVFPAGGDLRAHWDSLQPFFMAIWSP